MRAAIVVTIVGVLALGGGRAAAQEAEVGAGAGLGEWLSGNVALISDYTFRGISQTLEEPSIQGGIDLAHPTGLYLGAWGASVNFGEDLATGPRAQMELDVYGGWGADLFGLAALDLGAIYYAYPGADADRNYDFLEVGAGASREVGPVSTELSLKYSPDFYAGSGSALYYGLSLGVPVSRVTLSGAVGRQAMEDNAAFGTPDYTNWGLGATVDVAGFGISGTYIGTDLEEGECFGGSELCGGRAVFGVSRSM